LPQYFEKQSTFKKENMKKKLLSILPYIAAIGVISVLILLIYSGVQQVYRTNANDPQLDLVYSIRAKLEAGADSNKVLPDPGPDLAHGSQVFAGIYSVEGRPIKSSSVLDGKLPELPAGVFSNAREHGENRISWQPRSGVRMAMVIIPGSGAKAGFIIAGRSLHETEDRIQNLNYLLILGWSLAVGIILIAGFLQYRAQNVECRMRGMKGELY
jgi:hypothetical protein